jgi:hypothetical protein
VFGGGERRGGWWPPAQGQQPEMPDKKVYALPGEGRECQIRKSFQSRVAMRRTEVVLGGASL